MSQLSAQSIEYLCTQAARVPMIHPFSSQKIIVNGKSRGLSSASYDFASAQSVILGVNPAIVIQDHVKKWNEVAFTYKPAVRELEELLRSNPPMTALISTIEDVDIPHNVVGYVCDKSTYARMSVSAFNTLFDPGFHGNPTIELVNFGDKPVTILKGDPVCQFTFHWLDEITDRPYSGKYQGQRSGPQEAIHELSDDEHEAMGAMLYAGTYAGA
jgi:deoxycytidine triphosphate deaminase